MKELPVSPPVIISRGLDAGTRTELIQKENFPSEVRKQHREKTPFEQEWEIFKAAGSDYISHRVDWSLLNTRTEFFSKEEILVMWSSFIDDAQNEAIKILDFLNQELVDEVHAHYDEDSYIASAGENNDGTFYISFQLPDLVSYFIRTVGHRWKSIFIKNFSWYRFVNVLSHELFHIKELRLYPRHQKFSWKKEYKERLTEYGARLFALQWLRQMEHPPQDRLAIWLARAQILIGKGDPLSGYSIPIRRVQNMLGTSGKLEGLKRVFFSKTE